MPSLVFEVATESDDTDLRRLLRENPIQGSISLSFEREPCYFDASIIEGSFHHTIIAREADMGNVIAFGNRSVRPLYVSGEVRDIGGCWDLSGHWPAVGDKGVRGLSRTRGPAAGAGSYRSFRTVRPVDAFQPEHPAASGGENGSDAGGAGGTDDHFHRPARAIRTPAGACDGTCRRDRDRFGAAAYA